MSYDVSPPPPVQGLLLSSAQQMLDRLVTQIRDQVRSLRDQTGPDPERTEPPVARAEAVCEDAQRCKQVGPRRLEVQTGGSRTIRGADRWVPDG